MRPSISILPVGNLARTLQAMLSNLQYGKVAPEQEPIPLPRVTCVAYIERIIDDRINEKLKWFNREGLEIIKEGDIPDDDGFIVKEKFHLVEGWAIQQKLKYRRKRIDGNIVKIPYEVYIKDKIVFEMLEEFEHEVLELVDSIIPRATWFIWSTKKLGDDLIIERGRDFRIVDWERLQALMNKDDDIDYLDEIPKETPETPRGSHLSTTISIQGSRLEELAMRRYNAKCYDQTDDSTDDLSGGDAYDVE